MNKHQVTNKTHPNTYKAICDLMNDTECLGTVMEKFDIPKHIDILKIESELSKLNQKSGSASYKEYCAWRSKKKKYGIEDPIEEEIEEEFTTPNAYGHYPSEFDMFVLPVNDMSKQLIDKYDIQYSEKFLTNIFNEEDGLKHSLFCQILLSSQDKF